MVHLRMLGRFVLELSGNGTFMIQSIAFILRIPGSGRLHLINFFN